MTQTLNETRDHLLTLEKVQGQWWLELVTRATGQAQIMYFERKDKALAFFDRMPMPEIVRMVSKLNVPSVPMYKEGI